MRVFVTGATGLIGRALCEALPGAGHACVALTRSEPAAAGLPSGVEVLQGDPARAGPWQEELVRCDACVHLAGEPIAAGRWTGPRKKAIEASRVESTAVVAGILATRGPGVLVQGSAVGYYGSRGDERLDERSAAGDGFLAGVTQRWEAATAPARRRARVVLLRTGMVLAKQGGALEAMVKPFRLFAGGPVGDPAAWKPWIHVADEVALILWALREDGITGPLNACAPEPVRGGELARAIGKALRRPSVMPAPGPAVRALLGSMAEMVLASQRVVPAVALEHGFQFRFPTIGAALRDLL